MRIYITVSEEEQQKLKADAEMLGYPSISELVKARALNEQTALELNKKLLNGIETLPNNSVFYIRNICPSAPSALGTWLNKGINSGKIRKVFCLGKYPRNDACLYLKTDILSQLNNLPSDAEFSVEDYTPVMSSPNITNLIKDKLCEHLGKNHAFIQKEEGVFRKL